MPASRNIAPALLALLWAAVLVTGCDSLRTTESVFGPGYQPSNVMRNCERLPKDLRRVVVLPLAIPSGRPTLEDGREALEPILQAELKKAGRFDCAWVSRQDMARWTGRSQWLSDDELPNHFFERLRAESGCDAVLFCELREYRAYPPLAVGWRFRLVAQPGTNTLWAADEVFDAGHGPVANAARRYQIDQEQLAPGLQDSRTILNSPRRFGQYAAAALLATLPAR
jgi:hypothetical protein